jgi:hypothetical protein
VESLAVFKGGVPAVGATLPEVTHECNPATSGRQMPVASADVAVPSWSRHLIVTDRSRDAMEVVVADPFLREESEVLR